MPKRSTLLKPAQAWLDCMPGPPRELYFRTLGRKKPPQSPFAGTPKNDTRKKHGKVEKRVPKWVSKLMLDAPPRCSNFSLIHQILNTSASGHQKLSKRTKKTQIRHQNDLKATINPPNVGRYFGRVQILVWTPKLKNKNGQGTALCFIPSVV